MKHRISKVSNQSNKTKQNQTHKNSPENHAIYMKGNLKQLMSKNIAPKKLSASKYGEKEVVDDDKEIITGVQGNVIEG